jgi:beta-1,4-mannosyl-glycoprotein beta-1,4-N-acetylglucosaminyltransferase
MKIFDCFTFYNEFDILELRLNELWDTVDYFVISEASSTHSGNPKPFLLEENWDRFEKYSSKIRHLKNTDVPLTGDSWVIERWQRKCIERGLTDLAADDIVIVSDCDEIPSSAAIQSIKEDSNNYDRYVLGIPLIYFKLNYKMSGVRQRNIMVTRGRVFTDPQSERAMTFSLGNLPLGFANDSFCVLDMAGWHFTYFGDTSFAKNKIFNFAHTETAGIIGDVDNMNVDWMIENKVGLIGFKGTERFEYIVVDDYFPDYITNNLDRWQHMIVPGATKTIEELY